MGPPTGPSRPPRHDACQREPICLRFLSQTSCEWGMYCHCSPLPHYVKRSCAQAGRPSMDHSKVPCMLLDARRGRRSLRTQGFPQKPLTPLGSCTSCVLLPFRRDGAVERSQMLLGHPRDVLHHSTKGLHLYFPEQAYALPSHASSHHQHHRVLLETHNDPERTIPALNRCQGIPRCRQ